jgi:hypothetical protein
MMVKGIKEIKKQPEAETKPQIKSGKDTACSCGCKPPPRK